MSRYFVSVEEIKRKIALLSKYKINVFHWHLNDHEVWRVESKFFPMINDAHTMHRILGKYYTIDGMKEVIQFSRKHNLYIPLGNENCVYRPPILIKLKKAGIKFL